MVEFLNSAEYKTMQIAELSANIDQKLTELELQLKVLQARQAESRDAIQTPQLEAEIAALNQIKLKLLKSKDIAWRAHQLQQQTNLDQRQDQLRLLGLWLCIFSGVAAAVLLGIYLWSGIF